MALTGVHFILIIFGLNLIQTKHLLIETKDEVGTDYKDAGTDYKEGKQGEDKKEVKNDKKKVKDGDGKEQAKNEVKDGDGKEQAENQTCSVQQCHSAVAYYAQYYAYYYAYYHAYNYAYYYASFNGTVSKKEFIGVWKKFGGKNFNEEEAEESFKKIDKNGDGVIELDEFWGATEDEAGNDYEDKDPGKAEAGEQAFDTVFNSWDGDADGKVSKKEMMDVWKQMAGDKFKDDQAQEAFEKIDKNGDGVLEQSEFSGEG